LSKEEEEENIIKEYTEALRNVEWKYSFREHREKEEWGKWVENQKSRHVAASRRQ
jgi:hypothetical protein